MRMSEGGGSERRREWQTTVLITVWRRLNGQRTHPPPVSPPPHKCRRLTIIPQRAQHPVTSAHMRSKQLLSLKAPSLHHA